MTQFNNNETLNGVQPIFLGIDVHKRTWSLAFVQAGEVIKKCTIPADFGALKKLLTRYSGVEVRSVYEAGFSGYHLHRQLASLGVNNMVTAPNKLPVVTGDKVKTDKRDSVKLATFSAKGLLKGIYIPSEDQTSRRQILRVRNQIVKKKRATVNQIKSLLIQYGISSQQRGLTKRAIETLKSLELPQCVKSAMECHIRVYECLSEEIRNLRKEAIEGIAKDEHYKINYSILISTPGIGPLTAAVLLCEIGDWKRFNNEKQIAAYVGLTPSEYSSGDHCYRGRITGQGNEWLRSLLIEASWRAVKKDPAMKKAFERIFAQTGSKKKAIVAIARKLICRMYSLIKNHQMYKLAA